MKNNVLKPVAVVAGVALLLVMGFVVYQLSQKMDQLDALKGEKQLMTEEMYHRDSTINELMYSFNEIEDNLTFIRTRRGQLSMEADQEMNLNRKTVILQDIKLMDSMLVASSLHIEDLDKRLKDSGVRMRSFEARITALNKTIQDQGVEMDLLRQSIEEKDFHIAGLNNQIDMFLAVVEEKEETIRVKENTLEEKESQINQLNTGFLTMGTYKELKEQGILSRSGGVLGIGSTKTLKQNLSNDYFTVLDIREIREIPISSKAARIITEHPDDSYEFIMEDGLISALLIENPEEFWKISKYAVIETR